MFVLARDEMLRAATGDRAGCTTQGQGKTRPIGISAFEDKVVQDAVREVLEAMYEQDFLECS